jgi:hypothetical protein
MLASAALFAQSTPPAGGATAAQVAIGAAVAGVWTVGLLVLGLAHRTGRTNLLRLAARPASWATGLPGWAALPLMVALGGLAVAGLGFAWDVSLHIDNGRDPGPFANPSHYPIFVGLLILLASGWLAVVMPRGDKGRSGVRIAPGWFVPAGGVAMMLSASAALMAFPLDDVWHRTFGQDVTLWGPTHLVLITGGLLVFVGAMVLVREGRLHAATTADHERRPVPMWIGALAAGIVLAGLTVAYQQEFGYGIPQFRLMFHPLLIAMAGALALIPVRYVFGAGAALLAVLFAAAVNAALTIFVGPLMGEITLHFPLYVAEGVMVELAALALLRRSAPAYVVASGVLIGTLGVLAEWGWTHVWFPLPWPDHLVAPAMLRAVPLAVACGSVGLFVARCLARPDHPALHTRRPWLAPAAGLAVTLAILGSLLPTHAPADARAQLRMTPAGHGAVNVIARFTPGDLAENADWVQGITWQHKSHLVAERLHRVSEGVYRTATPLQITGGAKSLVRIQRGTTTASVPVRLPADPAIPVKAIPARASVDRAFVHDPELLQRERKPGVPGWLWTAASSAVLVLVLTILGTLCWAMLRVARPPSRESTGRARLRRPRRTSAPTPAAAP